MGSQGTRQQETWSKNPLGKNGPRKGCCHGAVVGIAWAVPDDNVFYRTSVSYIGELYKFEFIIQKYVSLGSSNF